MRLLLDTHIWLWGLVDPKRLGKRAVRALQNEKNELWLSSVSIWETVTLLDSKRIRIDGGVEDWLRRAFEEREMEEAPVTHEIAIATRAVTLPHRDPADRFIAATARVLELTLITADQQLLAGRGYKVLANDA